MKHIIQVRDFWNEHPVGTHLIDETIGTSNFFTKLYARRYRIEWHLNELIPFNKFYGKRMLEIGCGMGCDGVSFAKNGANYTGIDLSEKAVQITKQHFNFYNLKGNIQTANAQNLLFNDSSFDLIYSQGVIHHAPEPETVVKEIFRVLKPGGKFIVMLYHKNSFNYYIRILLIHRLIALGYVLLRSFIPNKFRKGAFERHYRIFKNFGARYFRASEFVNHCTDGPECPFAKVYSKRSARKLFSSFVNLNFYVRHFPLTSYFSWMPISFERFLAKRMGWYLFIFGDKPDIQ